MRACTVGTGTRNARAISSLDRPPTTRRVSATRASGESTGWQLTNISARTSSSILSGSMSSSTAASSAASRAYRSCRAVRRRIASIARRRAVAISQPAGLAGAASGHDTSASATASWAASSASPKSPVNRVSAATIRADSIRQTASTSAVPISSGRCSRAGPSLTIPAVLRDLVLPGHPPDLDLGPGDRRDPLGPLDRLLLRGDIEQEEAPEQFLGLSVRPVRDHRGLAAEVDHDALARIVQPFGRDVTRRP